jgi:hypothetical protein
LLNFAIRVAAVFNNPIKYFPSWPASIAFAAAISFALNHQVQ